MGLIISLTPNRRKRPSARRRTSLKQRIKGATTLANLDLPFILWRSSRYTSPSFSVPWMRLVLTQWPFKVLHSATNLALRASKSIAQSISCAMANLVVLDVHIWLNLTEIKDANKMALLDKPVSPSGLFGSAVDGFGEHVTAAQNSSQAMCHFLPKRTSYSTALSHPKLAPAPTQPQAKAEPEANQKCLPISQPSGTQP